MDDRGSCVLHTSHMTSCVYAFCFNSCLEKMST